MITLSYGYGEFVNYEKYAENFFEDPLILGLCHLYVSEVSGSLSVDKSRHRCHFDMIFRCNLYSLQGRLLIWSSKHRSWLPKSLTLSEREGSFSFAFMQSSSSSWRSNRSRILCIQFSKFCLVNGSMTYCLRPFVFPLLPVRSAWFRLMPSGVPFSSVTVCSVMKRSISERGYMHFPPSVVYRMRCPSRIR